MSGLILEEVFVVDAVNPDGKIYLRVSRIACKSLKTDLKISLDINADVFPVEKNEKLTIAIATTLEKNGQAMAATYDHSIYNRETRLDEFDYACFGRVFDCNSDDVNQAKMSATISCGGLLARVEGSAEALRAIQWNQQYYILIRKVA